MATPLLALRLHGRRDVLVVRQRARQVAGLLGFGPADRAQIAAAAFEIARGALTAPGGAVRFLLDECTFRIEVSSTRAHASSGEESPDSAARTPKARWDAAGTRRLFEHLRRMPAKRAPVSFERTLPDGSPGLAREDIVWLLRLLGRLTPVDLFEEMRQQNDDFLALLAERASESRDASRPAA